MPQAVEKRDAQEGKMNVWSHHLKGAVPSGGPSLLLQPAVHLRMTFTLQWSLSRRHGREMVSEVKGGTPGRKHRTLSADFTVEPGAKTMGNSSVTLFKVQGNMMPLNLPSPSIYCLFTPTGKLV